MNKKNGFVENVDMNMKVQNPLKNALLATIQKHFIKLNAKSIKMNSYNENIQVAYECAERAKEYINSKQGEKDLKQIAENAFQSAVRLQKTRRVPWQRLHQPMTL